jgi:imidazolonepropionase-like amidohydrolase
MAHDGVYLDPTLAVIEAYGQFYGGKADSLNRSLVQQTVTTRMMEGTRAFLASKQAVDNSKAAMFAQALASARSNLVRAWKAGVPLAMGTDSGNPLVFHGPSMYREMQLWVEAGIPAPVVLQAATHNGARLLRAYGRFGSIRKGLEANVLLVDGNPLEDINAMERISLVVFKGERVRRSELFEEKK